MRPRDYKAFVIGFHVLKDGSLIKIFNDKTITIEKNSSEKWKCRYNSPYSPYFIKDSHSINTFVAEGENGLIAFADDWHNKLVILDLKNNAMEEFSFPDKVLNPFFGTEEKPSVTGLFALQNGVFKENNNFIIYFYGLDNIREFQHFVTLQEINNFNVVTVHSINY